MLKSWLATACGIGLLWGLAATAAAQEYDPEPQEPKTLGERMQDVGRAIFGGPTVPPPQSQTQSTPPSFPGYGTRHAAESRAAGRDADRQRQPAAGSHFR